MLILLLIGFGDIDREGELKHLDRVVVLTVLADGCAHLRFLHACIQQMDGTQMRSSGGSSERGGRRDASHTSSG